MVDSGESFAFVFRLFGLGKEREDFNYQFCIFDCGERERSVPSSLRLGALSCLPVSGRGF